MSTLRATGSELRRASTPSGGAWQQDLAEAIRDPRELLRALELPDDLEAGARRGAELFPIVVPRSYLARMQLRRPDDPLLRQVLPLNHEDDASPGFTADPLDEGSAQSAPGLLQKYHGRVLLIATGTCAIHCRYCFRRHFPYESAPHGLAAWKPALDAIRADASIDEVILSGGDPLILTNHALSRLLDELESIPHLLRLRIHTRLPIVLPSRMERRLLERLRSGRLTTFLVVHANHAAELVDDCAEALEAAVDAGIPTLNQAVLLHGVNDSEDALYDLCRRLLDLRVLPYYLHQLDRVQGAAHFQVPESLGVELVAALRRKLPGYAVPRYVREDPGEAGKTPIPEI